MRALSVSSLQAEPARPGGDDGRTRPVAGTYDHYALGVAIRTLEFEKRAGSGLPRRSAGHGGWTRHTSKFRGEWGYLYRAVDRAGRTVDFRLSAKRDVAAAKAFFRKAIKGQHDAPRTITLDGYAASHRAVRELKADGLLPAETKLRSSKYLNNLIEQDHRGVKQRIATMLGFKGLHDRGDYDRRHRIDASHPQGTIRTRRPKVQGRLAPAVWNAVRLLEVLDSTTRDAFRRRLFAPEPSPWRCRLFFEQISH